MGPIAWLASSRTLAVNWLGTPSAPASLRLLDTAAPGDDLLSSRAVLPLDNPAGQFRDLTISPDGRVLVGTEQYPRGLGVVQGRSAAAGDAVGFSARTGQARLLYQPPTVRDKWTGMTVYSNCLDPLWISNSGQQVLLMCTRPRPEGPQRIVSVPRILLLDHGRVIRLPWLTGIAQAVTAFGGQPHRTAARRAEAPRWRLAARQQEPRPGCAVPASVPPPAARHPCQTQPWTCRAGA